MHRYAPLTMNAGQEHVRGREDAFPAQTMPLGRVQGEGEAAAPTQRRASFSGSNFLGAGLIFFPHSSRQWLSANHFLNVLHGAPPAGLGGGQPLQQPVHTAPLAPPLQPPATTFPPNPIDLLASLADEWGTWPTPPWYA